MAKPIKLYSHNVGPNPWKVVIVLEELGIPYEAEYMEFSEVKKEPYVSINPNGRVPAIEDPNTGVKVWESGAVIEYLLENYDTDHKLSYTTSPEKYEESSWKHFQMSGQGPYFGQKAWFTFFHPEKNLTTVIDRYATEIRRVLGVIDTHLKKTGRPYLVGEKVSFADLMFVPWNNTLPGLMMGDFDQEWQEKFPLSWAWHQRLIGRESVQKAIQIQAEAKKAAGH